MYGNYSSLASSYNTGHPFSQQNTVNIKKLESLTLKYDRNVIIKPNPDKRTPEQEVLIEKVPRCLSILQGFALDEKNQKPDKKDAIHCAFTLKSLSDQQRFRRPLALTQDFIETMCMLINISNLTLTMNTSFLNESLASTVSGLPNSAMKRCQQHALSILNNLLLEDATIDSYIANDENCLPGVGEMLCSDDIISQELAARMLDYLSISKDNQTLICNTDGVLSGVVTFLNTCKKSIEARIHVLQALVYLSSNEKNRFILARAPGMLDELGRCLSIPDMSVLLMTMQVLYNIILLKENISLIAKNTEIRKFVEDTLEDPADSTDKDYENILKLCSFVLDLCIMYDNRLDSKLILNGESFEESSILIVPTIVGDARKTNAPRNESRKEICRNDGNADKKRREARRKSLRMRRAQQIIQKVEKERTERKDDPLEQKVTAQQRSTPEQKSNDNASESHDKGDKIEENH